jgi:putative ABC transport system ATP-binding protein
VNIKVIGVTKTFKSLSNSFTACDDISLDINKGDFIAFTGHTGSGKSTLLSMIGGILSPTKGNVFYNSYKLSNASESDLAAFRRKYFSFIFQHPVVIPSMSVMDNILMPLAFKDGINEVMIEQTKKYIELFGLKAKSNTRASNLSGGEMKKVSILRALSYGGEVLIADEPTNDLDPETIAILTDIFSTLNKMGVTIIMVTHAHAVATQARTVYEMKSGKITRTLK